MPRKINKGFTELDFIPFKKENKYYAYCTYCGHELSNTAFCRLQAHRSICKNKNTAQESLSLDIATCSNVNENSEIMLQNNTEETIFNEIEHDNVATGSESSQLIEFVTSNSIHNDKMDIQIIDITNQNNEADKENISNMMYQEDSTSTISLTASKSIVSRTSVPASPSLIKPSIKRRKKKELLSNFIDQVSDEQLNEFNTKLSTFFFGCNISFNIIESDHFKNFVKALRPAYALHLPGRKALSTTLLEKEYERCLKLSREFISSESVLLIDGWKNTSNNSKTVVTMLHNAKGSAAFLNAWDVTEESETADKLTDIVNESIQIAKDLYETTIYAIVSDNAANMLRMGRNVAIWHSTCNSHIANLLAKDVMNESLTKCVKLILKEFKHSLFEKALINLGGTRIITPCDTRWCTYRDSYVCLLKNISYMKRLIVDDDRFKKIKTTVKTMIFDDEFLDDVKDNIELFDPICNLINIAQKFESSAADVVHLWLTFHFPEKFCDFQSMLEKRKKMAFNIYVLVAYYLHPKYHDDVNETFSVDELQRIQTFLLENLDEKGIFELQEFQTKNGIFRTLFNKHIEDPILFGNMAKIHYPNLSFLALRLEKIPASSAQIERVFSSWSFMHSPIPNRLDFERSRKLLHIYYTHKITDSNICNDY